MSLFSNDKPPRWFFEVDNNPNSNTVKIQIYRHGTPYARATTTLMDDCKEPELEKVRFINMIKLIYDEGRKDC
jgi:hypothetical protein